MKNLIELPTFAVNGDLELYYVSDRQSGYGHKTITVELIYKGEKKSFSHTTYNMPGYDDAMDLDYEEKQVALYELIVYYIEDAVSEWTQDVDYNEENKD